MRPMIDELELPQVQEIGTYEHRALAELKVPAMDGSLLQNLGRSPAHVALWGIASGPQAKGFLSGLEEKFRAGGPVAFTADISASTEIEELVIQDLKTQEVAGRPDRFAYVVTLAEHLELVEPEETSLLDDDLLGEATDLIDDLAEGLDIGLDFATGLGRFVEPLAGLLARVQAFNQSD